MDVNGAIPIEGSFSSDSGPADSCNHVSSDQNPDYSYMGIIIRRYI